MERLKRNKGRYSLNTPAESAGFLIETCKELEHLPVESVIAATSCSRRLAFIRECFPDNIPIYAVAAGEEPDIPDILEIARYKMENASAGLDGNSSSTLIVAADTQTLIPEVKDYELSLVSHGKPENNKQVYEIFTQLYQTYCFSRECPRYVVQSGSVNKINGASFGNILNTSVELDPKLLEHFVFNNGINDYLQAFSDFYRHPGYSMPEIEPTDISGGLSLPVLVSLKAVISVNGISRDDIQFIKALKEGIFTVAVGISPEILRPFVPDVNDRINNWSWLNQITKHSLNG